MIAIKILQKHQHEITFSYSLQESPPENRRKTQGIWTAPEKPKCLITVSIGSDGKKTKIGGKGDLLTDPIIPYSC